MTVTYPLWHLVVGPKAVVAEFHSYNEADAALKEAAARGAVGVRIVPNPAAVAWALGNTDPRFVHQLHAAQRADALGLLRRGAPLA